MPQGVGVRVSFIAPFISKSGGVIIPRGSKNAFIKEGHFVCECGREFTKSQSLYAHQGRCKIHLGERYDPEKHKGWNIGDTRAWSRGLTKDTSDSVRKVTDALKLYYESHPASFSGQHHTEATKVMMAANARENAKNHLNGWKAGNNRIPNQYEQFTADFLQDKNIPYLPEVTVKQSELGCGRSYYQMDFLVNGSIDLEIDGSSHNATHDAIRDNAISKKFTVYRIQHHDSIDELEQKLKEFIEVLPNIQNQMRI